MNKKKVINFSFLLLALVLIFGQAASPALAAGRAAAGANPIRIVDAAVNTAVNESVQIVTDAVVTSVNESVTTAVSGALAARSDIRVVGGKRTIEADSVVEQNIIVMGGELDVERDAVIKGDISIYGGEAEFERDSEIHGTVRVYSGDLSISGTVYGDIITLGGSTNLESTAVVEGNVKTVGGNVNRSRSAVIRGDVMSANVNDDSFGFDFDILYDGEDIVDIVKSGRSPFSVMGRVYNSLFGSFVSFIFYILITIAAAFLLMKVAPQHVAGAENYLVRSPWMTFLIGLVISVIVVPVIVILLSITILLIPLALLLVLALIIMMFYGFVILGSLIGKELKRRIGLDWDSIRLTVLGTAVLIVGFQIIDMLPSWIDWIPEFFAVSFGVGAVSQYLYDRIVSNGKNNSTVLSTPRSGPVTIPNEGTLDQPETFTPAPTGTAEPEAPSADNGSDADRNQP